MMDPELDDPDVWTYGTVLKNPGCDFIVMYLGPRPGRPSDFIATPLVDGIVSNRRGEIVTCGGRPDDPRGDRWVVLP
jgi:hypothetical protein